MLVDQTSIQQQQESGDSSRNKCAFTQGRKHCNLQYQVHVCNRSVVALSRLNETGTAMDGEHGTYGGGDIGVHWQMLLSYFIGPLEKVYPTAATLQRCNAATPQRNPIYYLQSTWYTTAHPTEKWCNGSVQYSTTLLLPFYLKYTGSQYITV